MTKKQKIEYVNRVALRFLDARNHGNNGNSWWYPKPFVMAYNVKMNAWPSIATLLEKMSERQREYYGSNEDRLTQMTWDRIVEDTAELCVEEIKELGAEDVYFAGRSGGWCEVEYPREIDELEDDASTQEVNDQYRKAKALEELEAKVANYIRDNHKGLNDYAKSDDVYRDMVEMLLPDDEIADQYRAEINDLTRKLK